VSGDNNGAIYYAPASKPTPNEVTVAVTYTEGEEKPILYSKITVFDQVKAYTGMFKVNDVTVNSEYMRVLSGKIRWEFDEYYEEGRWREYVGKGTATMSIERAGCGSAARFTGVPVEGRLKVYDDKKYEFLVSLVSDAEQTRTCRTPDGSEWEESLSPDGEAMNSGDPCGAREFYPKYSRVTVLSLGRKGGCKNNVRDRYQEQWSFKMAE
jgi:hypothetical protein